ncbi:unnamed protein product [Brassica rapa subsp. trilocularis]
MELDDVEVKKLCRKSKKSLDPCEDRVRGLKSFWVGLDVKIKRDFMKVSIAKLMKAFTSKSRKKGWSNEWPLAAVEERNSVSGNLESALGEAAARYNSALDMTALMNINVLKEDIKYNKQPFHGNLEEQVPCELQNLFSAVVSGEIKTEGVYCFILRDLLASLEEAKSLTKSRCDIKSGGCGTTNFVHHVISRCPSIFIIVLEWEKSETEKEIFETTKALEWEIDISRLYYKGLEQNTNYRLVSMVGYGEEEREHICMAYEKSRWVNLRRESLAGEVVGNNWKNVVRFCGEMKVRPEILFYEELPDP